MGARPLTCRPARAQVVKAEVVITTHETLAGDGAALRGITWDCIIMDQRDRMRTSFAKAVAALRDLPSRHRLLLSHTHPTQVAAPACSCHASSGGSGSDVLGQDLP